MPSRAACRLASVTRSGAGVRVMDARAATRGPLLLRQLVLLELVVQRGAVDLESPRGFGLVAAGGAHRACDQVALERLDLLAKRRARVRRRRFDRVSTVARSIQRLEPHDLRRRERDAA